MAKFDTLTFAFTAANTTIINGTGLTYVNGRGRLTLPTTAGGSYTQYMSSAQTFDLLDSMVGWEAPTVLNVGAGSTEIYYDVRIPNGDTVGFYWTANTLQANERIGGVTTYVGASVAQSTTTQAALRIRSVGQTIYWETRSTTGSWALLASKTTAMALTSATWIVSIGSYQTEPAGGYMEVDNLNLGLAVPASPTAGVTGVGALTAARPALSGAGTLGPGAPVLSVSDAVTGAGALASYRPAASGSGVASLSGAGALTPHLRVLSGTATVQMVGTGTLASRPATLTGAGTLTAATAGTGALAPGKAAISGTGALRLTGDGALTAGLPALIGTGAATPTYTGVDCRAVFVADGMTLAEFVADGVGTAEFTLA